jgi:hypothetical protein
VVVGLTVLGVAEIASKDRIAEEWWVHRLEAVSKTGKPRRRASSGRSSITGTTAGDMGATPGLLRRAHFLENHHQELCPSCHDRQHARYGDAP